MTAASQELDRHVSEADFLIELPWPPSELSPNARVHWRMRYRATQQYRWQAWGKAQETMRLTGITEPFKKAEAHVTFIVPDKRRRDLDNALAMLKPVWDGLVDAGLLVDDDVEHFTVADSETVISSKQRLVLIAVRAVR